MNDSILKKILSDKNSEYSKYCLSYLGNNEQEFLDILNSMFSSFLYDSVIHGKNHSERVLLFSFLLAKYYNLNEREQLILMDAAWYHDIGRVSDMDDSFHGMMGALKIEKVVNLRKYNQDEINILKAIIDAHSRNDAKMKDVLFDYDINDNARSIEIFYKLAKMLKDADALDRLRFGDYCDAVLDEKYLRYDYSKCLVDFATMINNFYKTIYRMNYSIDFKNGGVCYHSVGFDFFKFDSVLKYGILSLDEMKKKDIEVCKNFDGGNQDLWISVIDCDLIFDEEILKNRANSTSGYLEFINRGISFLCNVDNFVDALSKKEKERAMMLGVPFNQGNYYDERYVYKKISRANIYSVEFPVESLKLKISELDYIYNRLSVQQINKKLLYFEKMFSKNDVFISEEMKKELLVEYDRVLSETHDMKKLPSALFLVNKKINSLIQDAMQQYFNRELCSDEDVTVYQVIMYILKKHGLSDREFRSSFLRDKDINLGNDCVSYDVGRKYNVVRAPKIKVKK